MPAVLVMASSNNNESLGFDTGNLCSNPFRIPHHRVTTNLRNVPPQVREWLTHVPLGRKICTLCRERIHTVLKKRKMLTTSTRRSSSGANDRRRSEPVPASNRRRTESVLVPTSTTKPAAATPPNLKTTTTTTTTAAAAAAAATTTTPANLKTTTTSTTTTPAAATENLKSTTAAAPPARVKPTTAATAPDPSESVKPTPITAEPQPARRASLPGTSSMRNTNSNLTDTRNSLSEHTMSRRSKPQILQPTVQAESTPAKRVCCFCGLPEDNELEFGKFYEHSGIITHYYCLLLSSNMEQKGNDDEGILGFLADDIQKEIRRGKRLVCSYCRKNGATLGCCNTKCKRIFHLPCGLKAGSLHQFFGEFRSYCINHKPKQRIDDRVKNEVQNMSNILCYICYEDVQPLDHNGTLWAPCCKKNAWFHRRCVQQLAMSAGYFFKCPLCNNKREFQTAMLEYGIFIPRQDASWELVPNAFEELLYRHDHCDAKMCLCPKGRTYSTANAKWELVLCQLCGSQGTHVFCSQLKWTDPVWECQECMNIIKKSPENTVTTDDSTSISISTSTSNINSYSNSNFTTNSSERTDRRNGTTLNVTIREFEEDSDSDISVGNESLPVESHIPNREPEIKLRPGPRSFKLQQVQKMKSAEVNKECSNSKNSSTTAYNGILNSIKNFNSRVSTSSVKVSEDIICLDSDDEAVEILCESVMKRSARNSRTPHIKNINDASSSSNSMNFSNPMLSSCIDSSSNLINLPTEVTKILPATAIEENNSPFNIIISNVTSVPPEFFASVPEVPDDTPEIDSEAHMSSQLKRNFPNDEENDYEVVVEAPKRPRLEDANEQIYHVDPKRVKPVDNILLPDVKQIPDTASTTVLTESIGTSDSLESCHGDAGISLAVVNTGRFHDQHFITANSTADRTACHELPNSESPSPEADVSTATKSEFGIAIRTVLENGPTSHCSSGGSGGESSESRNSSGDRSRLMPESVHLSDLKFKICGNNLELIYGACKVQVKMNGMSSSSTFGDAGNVVFASVSSFAGSNQNLSSDKSSKSFQLRSDESSESSKNSKSLRTKSLKSFVYEDDNTLLEYPISANDLQNHVKILKKSLPHDRTTSRIDRNDLKENWNPERSSSSNIFDNLNNNNNNITSFADLKDLDISSRDKSNKNDDATFSQPQREVSDNTQRLLRRSHRIVRYFKSVQETNVPNGQVDGNWADSKSFPPFGKSNQMTTNKSTRSSRSLKTVNSEDKEKDKHFKNVNMNDLKFALTDKINGVHDINELDGDTDLKVSIDLQKISNLISAKPDLFLKSKNNDVRRMRVYSVDEKLKVQFGKREKKLKKSQSFDCLLDLMKDNLLCYRSRSKSFNDLSNIDSNNVISLTDNKDCTKGEVRRSKRRKTRQFEKHECVRCFENEQHKYN